MRKTVPMAQTGLGAEPRIAALADGTLFIAAVGGSQERPNAVQGAAWLWRSRDQGETWETLRKPERLTPLGTITPTRRPFASADADVVVSPDGWLYYADWWNWGHPLNTPNPTGNFCNHPSHRVGNVVVERSRDGGATWQSTSVTLPEDPAYIDRPWLVAGEDGRVGLVYLNFCRPDRDYGVAIKAAFSVDHGASWGQPVVVAKGGPVMLQAGAPRALPDGSVVVPYGHATWTRDHYTDASEVRIARSKDAGRTWDQLTVAGVPGGFDGYFAVEAAVDDVGRIIVVWHERINETMVVQVASSSDNGDTWTKPTMVRGHGLNFLPWIAAREDGKVAVTWYGSNATGDPTKAPPDTQWFVYVAAATSAQGPFRVIRADPQPVKMGAMCVHGSECLSDRELLDYTGVEFGPDGSLHLAYARSRVVEGVEVGHVVYGTARLGP